MVADVVIAGAGPNGLMLACELSLAGVRPVVLERLPEPNPVNRPGSLVGQVVRMLDRRGLYQPLAASERSRHRCPNDARIPRRSPTATNVSSSSGAGSGWDRVYARSSGVNWMRNVSSPDRRGYFGPSAARRARLVVVPVAGRRLFDLGVQPGIAQASPHASSKELGVFEMDDGAVRSTPSTSNRIVSIT